MKIKIVWCIALIVGFISIAHVIIPFLKTPAGTGYLFSGHYYLDYFVYLQAISQGMWGHWLVSNPYAIEDSSKTFLVWGPYLLIGKVARFFNLSPIVAYWGAIFLLAVVFTWLSFVLIRRLLTNRSFSTIIMALLLSLLAAPFSGYDFWYAPSFIFRRLTGVAHHLLGLVLVMALIISTADFFERKDRLIGRLGIVMTILVTMMFTMMFYPYNTINFSIAFFMVAGSFGLRRLMTDGWKNKSTWFFLLTMGVVAVVFAGWGMLVKHWLLQSEIITRLNAQDAESYRYFPPWRLVLLTAGPLGLLSCLGIFGYLGKLRKNVTAVIFLYYIVVSYVLSFTRLAHYFGSFNLRFLSPLSYILFAVLTVMGIEFVFGRVFKRKKLVNFMVIFVGMILLSYFSIVTFLGFGNYYKDRNLISPISYLPKGVLQGYEFLQAQPGRGGVVLTPPSQFLGTVLPIFTDRKVYVARHVFTRDYLHKNITSNVFFLGGMDKGTARQFVRDNKIEYVLLTNMEGYSPEALKGYDFLKEIYRNEAVVIYRTNR